MTTPQLPAPPPRKAQKTGRESVHQPSTQSTFVTFHRPEGLTICMRVLISGHKAAIGNDDLKLCITKSATSRE
jgi:hypothetical protein